MLASALRSRSTLKATGVSPSAYDFNEWKFLGMIELSFFEKAARDQDL
jgi:hypothetical protein